MLADNDMLADNGKWRLDEGRAPVPSATQMQNGSTDPCPCASDEKHNKRHMREDARCYLRW